VTLSDFVSDLARKLRPPPPYQAPPFRFTAAAVPAPIPAKTPMIPTEQPVASLVGTRDHARGRLLDGGGLIGGR